MRNLRVVYQDIEALTPYGQNARYHSSAQIKQIRKSIESFGFTLPLLVDKDGILIAGHGRLEAARLLGLKQVPIIVIADLTEAQIRAYRVADNKLAENASWDEEALKLEFLDLLEFETEVDLEVTGFSTTEIDLLTLDPVDEENPADAVPEPDPEQPVITRPGDLWRLGSHRILCGDALDGAAYERLLESTSAHTVFTDPPYNVAVNGHVSGTGKHREFAMASGEMSAEKFEEFLETVFGHVAAHSTDGSLHYICMDWRHLYELLEVGRYIYTELKNICVWAKTNGGMGSLYRSQHEMIAVFKHGTGPHRNNVQLGKHGRNRTNLWTYAGANSFREGRMEDLSMHPTVKPVQMVADAILDCTRRGEVVLDPFGGSGTTLMAAEQTRRQGHLLELDPGYVDLTIRRWEELTGETAIHAATGRPFAEMAELRAEEMHTAAEGAS